MRTKQLLLVASICLLLIIVLVSWALGMQRSSNDFDWTALPNRPKPQGDFFVSALPEPKHLNPFTTTDTVARRMLLRYTHDALMLIDPKTRKLIPAVAEVESENGLTVTFKLRDRVRFSNREPVTTKDVKFTFDVVNHPDVPAGALHGAVSRAASLEILDWRRFKVVFKEHRRTGLAGFASGFVVASRRWFLDEMRIRAEALGKPAPTGPESPGFGDLLAAVHLPGPGTGPYEIATDSIGSLWLHGRDITLRQNPSSWHRQAHPERFNLAGIRLRFLAGWESMVSEFRARRVDWLMPPDPAGMLKQLPDLKRHVRQLRYNNPRTGPFVMLWNQRKGHPTADVRVRRALTMMFPRQKIVDEAFGGNANATHSCFDKGSPEYPTTQPLGFDPNGARELMKAAGYSQDNRAKIRLVRANLDVHRRIVDLVKPTMARCFVDLEIQSMEWKAMESRRTEGEFDGFLASWGRTSPLTVDPHEYYHSTQNHFGYAKDRVDELLEKARAELVAAKRVAMYQELACILADDQPVTILVRPVTVVLVSKRYQMDEVSWMGLVPDLWWVEEKDQLHQFGRRR